MCDDGDGVSRDKEDLRPIVLVTNDDRIRDQGLRCLVEALVNGGRWNASICAPNSDKSGVSQSITTRETLVASLVDIKGVTAYEASRTPSHCVSLGLSGVFFPWVKPTLEISGINKGDLNRMATPIHDMILPPALVPNSNEVLNNRHHQMLDEEKTMFLDIAWCFVGEKRNTTILDSSRWNSCMVEVEGSRIGEPSAMQVETRVEAEKNETRLKETKLKSAIQLQDLLDAAWMLVSRTRFGRESDSDAKDLQHVEKLRHAKVVLEEGSQRHRQWVGVTNTNFAIETPANLLPCDRQGTSEALTW
eukprot:Gb_18615 [translate_table: standard]